MNRNYQKAINLDFLKPYDLDDQWFIDNGYLIPNEINAERDHYIIYNETEKCRALIDTVIRKSIKPIRENQKDLLKVTIVTAKDLFKTLKTGQTSRTPQLKTTKNMYKTKRPYVKKEK